MDRLVIGRRERVALPEWGVRSLIAKVDSGARTSALHVDNIEQLPNDRVRFEVVLSRRNPARRVLVEAADLARTTRVRPSSGVQHERHVVRTTVRIGPITKQIEISLVRRDRMLCRMLLGRTALAGDFLINVDAKYLISKPPRRRPAEEPT